MVLLGIILLCARGDAVRRQTTTRACPCADARLCDPINGRPEQEMYIFHTDATVNFRTEWNWNELTTIVLFVPFDEALFCYAHQRGVRILSNEGAVNVTALADPVYRTHWVGEAIAYMTSHSLDGVNVDIEEPMSEADAQNLNLLIDELRAALSPYPDALLVYDVAWSADCIDNRCYDYVHLAKVCDYLFLMEYDMQSQIYPPRECLAYANSPLPLVRSGIQSYLELGIAPSSLILGVPFYGYDYPCVNTSAEQCTIEPVPFRGAPCSDAAGSQHAYSVLQDQIQNSTQPIDIRYDAKAASPYYFYHNVESRQIHMVRFDDPVSLGAKTLLARSYNLRGMGMWNADQASYSRYPKMWEALLIQS